MSKIKDAKGRMDGNSGYNRVLGNAALGKLLSRVQATVISNGNELERLISSRCTEIDNIDEFIDAVENNQKDDGAYLCLKRVIKHSEKYANIVKGIEPDMIIFIVATHKVCKIVELKDGDMFDTKKSRSEKTNLENFTKNFGSCVPFVANYYICCFNQSDKDIIYNGFKGEFSKEHILTGKELCDILMIDYEEIINIRKIDARENFRYFISELLSISEVRNEIKKHLSLE